MTLSVGEVQASSNEFNPRRFSSRDRFQKRAEGIFWLFSQKIDKPFDKFAGKARMRLDGDGGYGAGRFYI